MNRSSIDVLMQSAFMQLGSQGTYNSLTDKRLGFLTSSDNTGLIEFEKTFKYLPFNTAIKIGLFEKFIKSYI